mmetsp:Transcript_68245/g.134891  ORF Transcript_68245/g.134891 Transcript_68245/m.134891 type:complete len:359 (-) Transcript_68245:39-1115(-)
MIAWILLPSLATTQTSGATSSVVDRSLYVPSVVVITTFPGEYHRWKQRLPLGVDLPFPAGAGAVPLGWNASLNVLGVVTGMGPRNAALTITALGHDPRFDLTNSHWLLAGIAGVDPTVGSPGCGIWARTLVDGDTAKFIDPREAPAAWPTGWVPLGRSIPYGSPPPSRHEAQGIVHELSAELIGWAFNRTRSIKLADSPALVHFRGAYASSSPNAVKAPSVLLGAVLSTSAIWEGQLSVQWARNWTAYWTKGRDIFATSAMEDVGIAVALEGLERAHRAKGPATGLLVLRTASNFVEPPPGVLPDAYLMHGDAALGAQSPPTFQAALEVAYVVGAPVVLDLVGLSRGLHKAKPIIITE